MKRIEKACKQCNEKFFIEYEPQGSGSGNAQRKSYCSDFCKKKWLKNPENGLKQTVICVICKKKIFLPPSHAKTQTTCSKECYGKKMSITNRKYEIIEKECLSCKLKFKCNSNSLRKFCTPKCCSTFKINRVEVTCEVCEKKFHVKMSWKTMRFCSVLCRRRGQSLGLVKAHTNGRTGWRSDIHNSPYFKSSLEADYARYCIYLNVPFKYEYKVFDVKVEDKKRFYTPDFYLPETDEYVELKGIELQQDNQFSQKLNTNSSARKILEESGLKIKVLYMKDFYSSLKELGLYDRIPNLENKDYAATKHLISTYKD